jgi:hypothetical protein
VDQRNAVAGRVASFITAVADGRGGAAGRLFRGRSCDRRMVEQARMRAGLVSSPADAADDRCGDLFSGSCAGRWPLTDRIALKEDPMVFKTPI